MNLNEFDTIKDAESGYKVIPKYKRLYTINIKFKPYYAILKKYNQKTNNTSYYLVLSDVIVDNMNFHTTNRYGNNGVKIDLSSIWKDTILSTFNKETHINMFITDSDDTTVVYGFDI